VSVYSLPRNVTRVVHSSDLHLGGEYGLRPLPAVLSASARVGAGVLLLAGDIFDHNRVADALLTEVREMLAHASSRVVILPGNHDCLGKGSCYERGKFDALPHVDVIGMADDSVLLRELDLEVWGKAHWDYRQMDPMPTVRERYTRWQIAMGHGHFGGDGPEPRYAWNISTAAITATSADYVALGHWDHPAQVCATPVACYSGSPQCAGSVTVIDLADVGLAVTRTSVTL
jgi:DNA repair exonuclease SbcCD nuclease subunit